MKTRTIRGAWRTLRARLLADTDTGVSIVEVAVAAFLIMILSIGVIQGTITSIRLSGDQRHRVTALSIAAGEIDLVRSMPNPFNVVTRPAPVTKTIDGTTYTLTRTAAWVTGTGTEITCGGGGGQNLLLRSVHVAVTWNGRLSSTQPVRSDTLLAPNGRINDPDLGTIVVAVTGANGQPIEGASVQITAVSGGAITPAPQPGPTNSEGCTYALEVEPGKYTVKVSLANYLDEHQVAAPVQTIESLLPGDTATLAFVYDHGVAYQVHMPTTSGLEPADAKYSSDNVVTFIQSGGQSDILSGFTNNPKSTTLFPRDEGYVAIAGKYSAASTDTPPRDATGKVIFKEIPGNPAFPGDGGCRALDPDQWLANAANPVLQPAFKDAASTGPTINAYMGYIQVVPTTSGGGGSVAILATQLGGGTTAVPGDPGCATAASVADGGSNAPLIYNFSGVLRGGTGTKLMLPFGTWALTSAVGFKIVGTSNPAGLPTAAINPANATTTNVTSVTVVVDPRKAG